jgi:hypothetical protein
MPEEEAWMFNSNFRRTNFLGLLFCLLSTPILWAQTRVVAIVGGTLIDGTGRAAIEDAAVVFHNGRIQEVGRRGAVGETAWGQT